MPQTSRQPRAPSRGLWRLRACPPRDLEDFARKAGHGRSRSQQPVTNVTKVASKRDQNEIDYILKCQAEAAHLLLELYTLYLFQLHIWSYLQVLAGLYSLDWAWWCDDMWCFSCKFIAIAVNSCALACIAIMAMLEESTSQPRFWPYREPMLQVLSKRIKERKKERHGWYHFKCINIWENVRTQGQWGLRGPEDWSSLKFALRSRTSVGPLVRWGASPWRNPENDS